MLAITKKKEYEYTRTNTNSILKSRNIDFFFHVSTQLFIRQSTLTTKKEEKYIIEVEVKKIKKEA